MNRQSTRNFYSSHRFEKERNICAVCSDGWDWWDVNYDETLDEMRIFQGKVHHRPSSHWVTQDCRFLKSAILQELPNILAHRRVWVICCVWRISVISSVYAYNSPWWVWLLSESLAQTVPEISEIRKIMQLTFINFEIKLKWLQSNSDLPVTFGSEQSMHDEQRACRWFIFLIFGARQCHRRRIMSNINDNQRRFVPSLSEARSR